MTSPEVTALLRDSRPSASPALRERVRTISSSEEARRPQVTLPSWRLRRPQLRLALAPAAAALLLISSAAIVGLVRSGDAPDTIALEAGRDSAATEADAKETAPVQTLPPAAGNQPTTTDRPQRYQAELTLSVENADALSRSTQRALTVTRSLGGYVVSSSFDTKEDTGVAYLTVRIPTARVQEAIVRLTSLGELEAQRIAVDDLGQQINELDRRTEALTSEIARLVRELASPRLAAEERSALRARLAEARSELAGVRAQRRQTSQEARYATVFLTLATADASAAVPSESRLERALGDAWDALLWELVAVVYAIVVLMPLALAAVGIWFAVRGMRRHQERQLLDQPGS
jgi:hypothetical protein